MIYTSLRKILELKNSGSTTTAFLRDTMAPLITEDTNTYKALENEIFT